MKSFLNSYIENKFQLDSKEYALIIGSNPSDGARSPKLWNKVYKKKKIKRKMYPADVKLKNLKNIIKYLKKDKKFIGGSVTVPYKEKIIKYLDVVDTTSKKINSVNTILKKKNKLIGLNTDYWGFGKSINKFNIKKQDPILVLGAGGAGKAVISFIIKNFKENKKYFFNRNHKKISRFIKNYNEKKCIILKEYKNISKIKDIKLIINTTSIGFNTWFGSKKKFYNLEYFSPLAPLNDIKLINKKEKKLFLKKNKKNIEKNLKISKKFFENNPNSKVYDIIYSPKKTNIMKHANSYKNYSLNGLNMNLDQAVIAFSKVNKIKSFDEIKKIMKK
jgi:shikimate dehydrogenase